MKAKKGAPTKMLPSPYEKTKVTNTERVTVQKKKPNEIQVQNSSKAMNQFLHEPLPKKLIKFNDHSNQLGKNKNTQRKEHH